MAIAEDLAVIHDPGVEDPFKVEQHGIDYIPVSERWASPAGHLRHVGRSERADGVLHLRRHPDDLRSHVCAGPLHHRPREPLLLPARSVLAAGAERGHHRLRHQPGPVRAQRLAPDLVLQLAHSDRLRSGGPDPHRGRRARPHDQSRVPPGRPGQGDPRDRGGADPGDPAVPRPCRHREDSAPPRPAVRRPLRSHAGLRHPARAPARRQDERRLAGLHRGARLHHRAERARMDRERERLHPLLPDQTPPRRGSWVGSSSERRCPKSSS